MRILYCSWNEYTKEDCLEAFASLGHKVKCLEMLIQNYNNDSNAENQVRQEIKKESYDCIFSFNYIPFLAKICDAERIKYVAWVFDSPHLTLTSKTISLKGNYVFIFDYALYEKMKSRGVDTVYYSPLAVNCKRLDRQLLSYSGAKYWHDVCFVGNLYNDQKNFFNQIAYLPAYTKGYLDAVIESQQMISGYSVIDEMLCGEILETVKRYVEIDMGEEYFENSDDIICSWVQKKVTEVERKRLLTELSERFEVALYTSGTTEHLPRIKNMGYCNYRTQMPIIFNRSKVNINITLRSILSGMPLRTLDVMGAGGFLVSNYQSELEEYFVNGEELVLFMGKDDLLDKVEYYLKHDSEREKIARGGREKVRKLFTYEERLKKIFEIVK